jgi:alpha,alpha-trehalase
MSQNFHELVPIIKERIQTECIREHPASEELLDLPYAYVTPGRGKKSALYYWDTYFINLGLIRLQILDLARYNVENLIYLMRKFGYVPASNLKSMLGYSNPPLLPWMVRDVYRATGDKEWLSRVLPDITREYHVWTNAPHTTSVGLYRYAPETGDETEPHAVAALESGWGGSLRFGAEAFSVNPVDLNALLYRNALILYDLQIEVEGRGDEVLLKKSDNIQKRMEVCWDNQREFYFDNNFAHKSLSAIRSLAGLMPLFVEMVQPERAQKLVESLKLFNAPGGLYSTEENHTEKHTAWTWPLCYAPYMFFVIKGLCDYEFMEDAADIGENWLTMVKETYKSTGELWEWYNAAEKCAARPQSVKNNSIMGWTAGVYIALLDTLGLE